MKEADSDRDEAPDERRLTQRVPGPFDGRWRAALTVPVRLFDLSAGGCFIQALHEVPPGRRITLDLELPYEGWITIDAETLYMRPDWGFAVRFVNVPEDVHARLTRVIHRLLTKSPSEE